MYFEIDLLTDGKIKNYPRTIPMKIMRIGHYKELKNAAEFDYEVFEPIMTSVLNNLVDWSRVEYIKTVDDLTKEDRLKLLYFQIINSKGGELTYTWECGSCDTENKMEYDLVHIEEIKLNKSIEDIEYKSSNDKTVIITHPITRIHIRLDNKLRTYREKAFKEIEPFLKSTIETQSKVEEIGKKIKYYKMVANPEVTNEDKINKLEDEMKEIVENIESTIISEEEQNKVKEILRSKKLFCDEILTCRSYKDLKFIKNLAEDLAMYAYIKDNDMEIEEYFAFIDDLDLGFYKKIEKFMEASYHAFDDKIEITCKNCGRKDKVNIDLSPKFFF